MKTMKNVYFARDVAEAYMIRDLLEDAGIQSDVSEELMSHVRGAVPLDLSTRSVVWIADEDREAEALELIRKFQAPAVGADWTCSCGEPNGPGFEVCWSCGGPRAP